ncbi:MAG: C40 family peptidase [Frankiaceae bacterium]
MPAVTPPARGRACRAARAATTLLISLGLAGTAVAAAQPAAAIGTTRVSATAATINYARHANVAIRVYDGASHPLGGVHVRVYRHTASGNAWVTTVTTSTSTHVAHFRPWLRRSTTYLLVYPGSATRARSTAYQRVYVRSFGASLVNVGSRKKGAPYQYGAAGPWRFDCSGFTRWVASRYGKSLPHSSSSQYGEVRHVARTDKRIGDLIFLHDSSGHVYHVGFYAGSGRLLAATHTGDYVRLERLWTSSYYVGRLRTP